MGGGPKCGDMPTKCYYLDHLLLPGDTLILPAQRIWGVDREGCGQLLESTGKTVLRLKEH